MTFVQIWREECELVVCCSVGVHVTSHLTFMIVPSRRGGGFTGISP